MICPEGEESATVIDFNGAAAVRPRRFKGPFWRICKAIDTSMGPRLLGRGDTVGAGPHGAPKATSMGPRLLGRGDNCGGWAARSAEGHFNGAAAVRPRRYLHAARRVALEELTSMGPRLLGRGDHWKRWPDTAIVSDFNGAAAVRPRR